ncbi:YitT family protein [Brassicibacter mesophilus]|uniref:YitT family protein n=1 Tax=Brassicibacter mesophilus TaxID=745119 RepID=UPI003D1E7B52
MLDKKQLTKRILLILAGSFISAVGINAFIIPHKLLSGGVTGLALIIQYLTHINSGVFILLFNIPIFLIGIKEVNKEFTLFSLIGMGSLSLFLLITKDLSQYLKTHEILLSSIYGGVLVGAGLGITFSNRASQGGTDIIAVVIKKRTGASIGNISFIINVFIVLLGASINGIEIALYTFITMYISANVLNRIIDGFERKRVLFIITQKDDEVGQAIMSEIKRGVTFLNGMGAYTGNEKRVIYCTVTLRQLPRVKVLVEKIDPTAFMTILEASEVNGRGFKKSSF